jgi:hypothetical protein
MVPKKKGKKKVPKEKKVRQGDKPRKTLSNKSELKTKSGKKGGSPKSSKFLSKPPPAPPPVPPAPLDQVTECGILEILTSQEKEFTIDEIAYLSEISLPQIYIWICSRGKQIRGIKKVGIGTYKYIQENFDS